MKRPDLIAALLPKAEGNPAAMLHLAGLLRQEGQRAQALALVQRALALAPGDPELAINAQRFLSANIPKWHVSIVRDAARNAAYDAALRRAVRPNARVLEIGTGTGLLAMMAARAGAAQVFTCEMDPAVAAAAREIIARNGFADRVQVIAKHSDALELEADLGGRVDILVSEIVSNELLGENVLPSHERAVRDLLKPDGQVIPARGHIRVALGEDVQQQDARLAAVDGFDLSPFNALLPPTRLIPVGNSRLALRSEASDLFTFDFGARNYLEPARSETVCRATGGRVNGIAQWIALDLDDESRYENQPAPSATSCWGVVFYALPHPIETAPGEAIRIFGAHDREHMTIWCDPAVTGANAKR